MRTEFLFIAMIFSGLCSCEEAASPKPHGELRIDLPDHSYIPTTVPCPFNSEVSELCLEVLRKNADGNCWLDLSYPEQNATVYLTYKPVQGDLKMLLDEAHKLTYEHHVLADGILTRNFTDTLDHVYGTFFELSGEVASNTQFYLTDSTKHFLRGALYFNSIPNEDSLAPVTRYIREDMIHFIEELHWKD